MSIPGGVCPLISTAVVAAIGAGETFDPGSDFGAWLGLGLRQYSTGGRSILGRISKRGSRAPYFDQIVLFMRALK
jgi:transposase